MKKVINYNFKFAQKNFTILRIKNQIQKFGKNKIGTTKKGIGPTYTDKYARQGIRIEDLFDEELLSKKVDIILERKNLELKNLYIF